MNGYSMMSQSYRILMERGEIDKKTAEKSIRIYDFMAGCDQDDLFQMIDSSAFNDMIRAFLSMAIENADIDDKSKNKVIGQLGWIFDEKSAKEVFEEYK